MLDSGPMYNWRKLLVVVLLMLSLSARAFAGASLGCEISRPSGQSASVVHESMMHISQWSSHGDDIGITHHHPEHAHDGFHHHGGGHCGTCVSCCLGEALPPVAVAAAPAQLIRDVATVPSSVALVRFLTGGIERPPRTPLL